MLGLLALNKQLDLHRYVFVVGREATIALGWYDQRDRLHVIFPLLVGAALVVVLAALAWRVRAHARAFAPIVLGFVVLAVFVVIRVALFSHLARVLG